MRYYRRKNEEKTAVKIFIANRGIVVQNSFFIFGKNVVEFFLTGFCHVL